MRSILKVLGAGATLSVSLLVLASPAWSSHGWVKLDVEPKQVRAGETVTIIGGGLRNPVEVRLGSLDGTLLGTFQVGAPAPPFGLGQLLAKVTIPADLAPGQHLLSVSSRGEDGSPARIPGWTTVTVVGPGGSPVLGGTDPSSTEPRPTALTEEAPVGNGQLLLVGVGIAGATLLLAVPLALAASRRPPPASKNAPEQVSS